MERLDLDTCSLITLQCNQHSLENIRLALPNPRFRLYEAATTALFSPFAIFSSQSRRALECLTLLSPHTRTTIRSITLSVWMLTECVDDRLLDILELLPCVQTVDVHLQITSNWDVSLDQMGKLLKQLDDRTSILRLHVSCNGDFPLKTAISKSSLADMAIPIAHLDIRESNVRRPTQPDERLGDRLSVATVQMTGGYLPKLVEFCQLDAIQDFTFACGSDCIEEVIQDVLQIISMLADSLHRLCIRGPRCANCKDPKTANDENGQSAVTLPRLSSLELGDWAANHLDKIEAPLLKYLTCYAYGSNVSNILSKLKWGKLRYLTLRLVASITFWQQPMFALIKSCQDNAVVLRIDSRQFAQPLIAAPADYALLEALAPYQTHASIERADSRDTYFGDPITCFPRLKWLEFAFRGDYPCAEDAAEPLRLLIDELCVPNLIGLTISDVITTDTGEALLRLIKRLPDLRTISGTLLYEAGHPTESEVLRLLEELQDVCRQRGIKNTTSIDEWIDDSDFADGDYL